MYVSRKLHIEATCNTTIGKKGPFAVRLQPNHPTDTVKDGQLQKLQRTHLYSPNYPQDKRSKKEKLKDWKKDSR